MSEQILVGRYHLQGLVGHKTDLFYALDETFGRKVVVKCLPGGGTEENRLYWEQEIAKAAGLQYPHLLGVFDIVVEAERIYLITEAIEGETLAGYVRRHAPMSPAQSIEMIRQLTGTVVQAEKHGVEISIEPHSVYVNEDGQIKVIGYGPLLHGEPRIESTDKSVQTLGILLYEMLTGKAYSFFTPPQRLSQEIADVLEQVTMDEEWVPERMQRMILSALSAGGTDRYPSVLYLYKDLQSLYIESGVEPEEEIVEAVEPEPVLEPAEVEMLEPAMKAQVRKIEFAKKIEEQHTKKRSVLPYVGGVVALLLVFGGLWWTFGDVKTVATVEYSEAEGKEIQMPNLLGKTEEQATQILSENGYPLELLEWVYKPSDAAESKGKVYRQSIDSNKMVKVGEQKLILTVNALPPGLSEISEEAPAASPEQPKQPEPTPGVVPDLRGMTQQQAEQALVKLGYHYTFFIEVGDTAAGTVFRQSIEPGTKAEKKTKITFYISR